MNALLVMDRYWKEVMSFYIKEWYKSSVSLRYKYSEESKSSDALDNRQDDDLLRRTIAVSDSCYISVYIRPVRTRAFNNATSVTSGVTLGEIPTWRQRLINKPIWRYDTVMFTLLLNVLHVIIMCIGNE